MSGANHLPIPQQLHLLFHNSTHLAPRLPLMMGAVTTLLPFIGWLITDRGTVILVGSFPYKKNDQLLWARKRYSKPGSACLWRSQSSTDTSNPHSPKVPLLLQSEPSDSGKLAYMLSYMSLVPLPKEQQLPVCHKGLKLQVCLKSQKTLDLGVGENGTWDWVSLYSPGCPSIQSSCLSFSSARITGMHHPLS